MSACPHYLEMPTGVPDADPQTFECDAPLDHIGKHRCMVSGVQAVGPRPKGGKPRKYVQVWIEWDR